MKHHIRIAVLAVLTTFCFITAAHAADSFFELNGFAFSISDEGKATIRSYSGSDTDMIIPNTLLRAPVESIGDYAFYENETVSSVSFERAAILKNIGTCAFYGCTSLSEVSLPVDVELAFGAFQKCTALTSLTIAEGISEIPAQCFFGCSALSELSLPSSVTAIGDRAFSGCTGLHRIDIPDSVTEIADNAFDSCNNLVIYAAKDSFAVTYAADHAIPCVLTDVDPADYYVLGDADDDHFVTVLDATAIQRKLAELPVKSFNEMGADIDGNGLDILDATKIQRHLATIDNTYPIGTIVFCSIESGD